MKILYDILENQDLDTVIDHENKQCVIYSLNLLSELIKESKEFKTNSNQILELRRKEYIVILNIKIDNLQ